MRTFLSKNYMTIKNGFINEGLIPFDKERLPFEGYLLLERHYFEALKRNVSNRTLTFEVFITSYFDFHIL